MTFHLRTQLTLLPTTAGGRASPILPGEFRTVLMASGRRFSAIIVPEQIVVPGGAAVHCEVAFVDPKYARSFFPTGGMFELWEGERKGYGQVLAQVS